MHKYTGTVQTQQHMKNSLLIYKKMERWKSLLIYKKMEGWN